MGEGYTIYLVKLGGTCQIEGGPKASRIRTSSEGKGQKRLFETQAFSGCPKTKKGHPEFGKHKGSLTEWACHFVKGHMTSFLFIAQLRPL